MDHYIDITLLPDPVLSQVELCNTLFARLHRMLGQYADGRIGISFPHHKRLLGDCLRLHGTSRDLHHFMELNWQQGINDYIQLSAIEPVPAVAGYRTVRRIQAKSVHNKRKRSIAKGWLSYEEALIRIPLEQQKPLKYPYAEFISGSNGNRMRLYIEHGPLQSSAVAGSFNSYGLSAITTIPWF